MKVGSRGDYGLRALAFLASRYCPETPIQVHAMAQHQKIPEDYLRQLLVQLRSAGLVKSIRGPRGGYLLARTPQEITMGEVLSVLEGPPESMECRYLKGEGEPCSLFGGCVMRKKWNELNHGLYHALNQTSLAELVSHEQALRSSVPSAPVE